MKELREQWKWFWTSYTDDDPYSKKRKCLDAQWYFLDLGFVVWAGSGLFAFIGLIVSRIISSI